MKFWFQSLKTTKRVSCPTPSTNATPLHSDHNTHKATHKLQCLQYSTYHQHIRLFDESPKWYLGKSKSALKRSLTKQIRNSTRHVRSFQKYCCKTTWRCSKATFCGGNSKVSAKVSKNKNAHPVVQRPHDLVQQLENVKSLSKFSIF